MATKNLKLTESQNVTQRIDVTLTLVSTSLSALSTVTFDNAFTAAPTPLSLFIVDGTKNRGIKLSVESVSASALTVRSECDATPSDSSVAAVLVVHGKF